MAKSWLDRRQFLARGSGGLAATLALAAIPGETLGASPKLGDDPFTLGVAAGHPLPDGIVLWTRLAPRPLASGAGGMPPVAVPVDWVVAEDPRLRKVVRRGKASATPELAHSVHVEIAGLKPGRDYWYAFGYRGDTSRVGRFRTAPPYDAKVKRLDFAILTCQDWMSGFFTPFQDLIENDLDMVLHLGDYIYEYAYLDNRRRAPVPEGLLNDPPFDLEFYRLQHALYKTDPDLQAAHAAFSWDVTWDDHEVVNDYYGRAPEFLNEPFLRQRAAAYQAFYEHLPLRRRSRPRGPTMSLYRRLRWGDLAEIPLLDGRQYRDRPPCGYGEQLPCTNRFDPRASMLGAEQERWLYAGLVKSRARWNVIAQQTLVAQLDHQDEGERFWTDSWDGYPAARNRLTGILQHAKVRNPVIVTGDWHSTFVNDIKLDFRKERSPVVATELVTPAVTSGGDGTPYGPYYGPMIPFNPHIKYFEGDRRGYFKLALTRSRLEATLRFVSTVESPTAVATTERVFVVEKDRPGAVLAGV